MQTLETWLSRLSLVGLTLFIAYTVLITVRAEAADVPRPKERARATQVLTRPDDAREVMPAAGLITGNGIVEPLDREVKLGAQVPGVISRVVAREGDEVAAGAVLVELVQDAERADLRARKADLEVAQGRARLSAATGARVAKLSARGAATDEEYERVRYQAEIDAAAVLQAEARVAEARARLERLTVRAPGAGTVLRVMVREGEYFNPAAGALLTLADLSAIRVRLDIDERQVGQVAVGQPAYVTARAFGERRFEGRVVELAWRMGRKTVRTDEPTERIDTTVREAVVQLEAGSELVQGLRVVGYVLPRETSATPGASR
ncbi:MAG: efflux RND transporter periplasmic adaptor subunit [Archangiaceae bacterium]|nr:efflux RND transporter periplasmic adaptor subunit [Archangiaceae bacterium]